MPTPTSREGYEKIRLELQHLETVEEPRIAKLIAEARAEGDLRENAEYHGQRENLAHLQRKIGELKIKLADAYIVDRDEFPKDVVAFGSRVKLRDLNDDIEETYELVGPGEEDYTGEILKILCSSPLAQQLLNHRVGDRVEVDTPGGKIHYEVVAIE